MLAAFLTTICWSFSVVFATRSALVLGGSLANISRMLLALVLLGIWAHIFGAGLSGPSLPYFLVSGMIGFGIGDIALFYSLTRIGPRLTILLAQTLAAPIGALAEWAWLGTRVTATEAACSALTLGGVALALWPDRTLSPAPTRKWTGIFFGVLAGAGQALGAVVSRQANAVALHAGLTIDGGTAAYQRMLGGILFAALFFNITRRYDRSTPDLPLPERFRRSWHWIVANAIAGPTLGVACYQWALATTPSAIVLPIVATAPVATMILTAFLENDRPSRRAIVGAIIAVAGAVLLTLARN